MKFRFSKDFLIDSDVAPWRREGLRIAMLGGPGSGKSWNNSLIAEQFLTQGGTVVIFQPRDEYFTLKEKFDVLSVGGVHAKDMEFALTSPSIYAKAVVEDGMSMIFYTSAAEDEEKLINWVSRFIRHLLNYQEEYKRPLLLILEEAQEYAPRSASGHVAPPWVYNRMVKAFKDCFTQGRKLNIIAVCSSQRPQELNFTIRQLANLTFFGKFSDQDIGYVDKECLKYIRKRGIKIDASELVTLGLGEWLVIMGEKTGYVKVTQKRLTKHGAETPRLEYVAPRTTQATKTIDELTKTIIEALKKEESEKSELEKAKRKIRDLTKRLETAEKKAEIKLSVKEMIEGGNSTELLEKLTKTQETVTTQREEIERFEDEIGRIMKRNDKLALELEQLKPLKDLKDALLKIGLSSGFEHDPKLEARIKRLETTVSKGGSVVYEVAPLEKIQRGFLEETKQKILADVQQLTDEQKKILKFVEAIGKGCNLTQIISRCLFRSATSGGTRDHVKKSLKEMDPLNLVRMDKNFTVYPILKDRIKDSLGFHKATKEEIETVYNHILARML